MSFTDVDEEVLFIYSSNHLSINLSSIYVLIYLPSISLSIYLLSHMSAVFETSPIQG